jgi:hypothetical protein
MFEAEAVAANLPMELIQIRTDNEFPGWLQEYVSPTFIRFIETII